MIFVAGCTLAFYLMQQLGMMLGFGAEMVLLFTYLVGRRAGSINETEDAIVHGIYHILIFALLFIIISGIGITAIHAIAGQASILFSPAYITKWVLILIASILAFLLRGARIWNSALEGISGANWGALFLLHIFAPITTYLVLGKLYGEFLIIFLVLWYGIMLALHLKPVVLQKAKTIQEPFQKEGVYKKLSFKDLFSSILSTNLTFKKPSTSPGTPVESEPPSVPTPPTSQPILFSPERTTQLSPLTVMPQSEEELQKYGQGGGIKEV